MTPAELISAQAESIRRLRQRNTELLIVIIVLAVLLGWRMLEGLER